MTKDDGVALLHALAGTFSIIIALLTSQGIPLPEQPIKTAGYILFAFGVLVFLYALAHLRGAFLGNVQPITPDLVTTGPYRVVRHPLYLAMLIMCVSLSIGVRSLWGLACSLFVFFPSAILRAKREETALEAKFGSMWREYSRRTRFILPYIY
jgi:protein-S-isoprenylcysteine O-methyltransferase Ste14